MFKHHNLLAICLTLALFASSAQAQPDHTIEVDPGTIGGNAFDQTLVLLPGDTDLIFTGGKALTMGGDDAPVMSFILTAGNALGFNGFLLDQQLEKIPNTDYEGVVEGDAASVTLLPGTAWSGMRLNGAFSGNYILAWLPPNPTVIEAAVIPEPGTAVLLCLGLVGVVGCRRRRATDSR